MTSAFQVRPNLSFAVVIPFDTMN